MCLFDSIFPYLQSSTLFVSTLFLFLDKFILKMNDNNSEGKKSFI